MYRFVCAKKARFEVRVMCRVLGISPSAYYDWERKQESERNKRDADLLTRIRHIFAAFRGRYGRRACTPSSPKRGSTSAANASLG